MQAKPRKNARQLCGRKSTSLADSASFSLTTCATAVTKSCYKWGAKPSLLIPIILHLNQNLLHSQTAYHFANFLRSIQQEKLKVKTGNQPIVQPQKMFGIRQKYGFRTFVSLILNDGLF